VPLWFWLSNHCIWKRWPVSTTNYVVLTWKIRSAFSLFQYYANIIDRNFTMLSSKNNRLTLLIEQSVRNVHTWPNLENHASLWVKMGRFDTSYSLLTISFSFVLLVNPSYYIIISRIFRRYTEYHTVHSLHHFFKTLRYAAKLSYSMTMAIKLFSTWNLLAENITNNSQCTLAVLVR